MFGELILDNPHETHTLTPSPGPKNRNWAKQIRNSRSASKMLSDDI